MSNHLRTQSLVFGIPWPELNEGLFYSDVVPHSDSELTLIDFYSRKYKNSAPLQGWLQRIQNGQISVDGRVVKDPNTILSGDSVLVYHRLPWKEPDVPHLLEVLYEDDDMIIRAQDLWCHCHTSMCVRQDLFHMLYPYPSMPSPTCYFRVNEAFGVALNKPSGLQVLPGGLFQQRTVLTQLCWSVKKQNSTLNSQETHPVPVHRLGRGTSDNTTNALYFFMLLLTHASPSQGYIKKILYQYPYPNVSDMSVRHGILLCAKTKVAKTRLAAYFADGTSRVGATSNRKAERSGTRKISKIYRALVTGILVDDKVIINQPIGIVRYPGVAKGLYVASPSPFSYVVSISKYA
ncbi:hypothetical protein GOBAR_AA26376 [Gossypium barbadense]|uniref:Pseudouridine synthase RsuA/RluA-like domain-containing protein n=1 Tax=Gossypium barbadense TaxID=3634 RepID=A0A2P5WT94_GOSBA|nr:hypothetical protein GOBAR_AA26376 [Gossypium barbadense]